MRNIVTGLTIIADCIDFRKPEIVAFVLTGHYDDILLETFYYTANRKISTGDEHKTDPRAKYGLTNLKDRIRDTFNFICREADREDQRMREQAMLRLREELKQSNKPHVLGTVAEIAARYNISKSEVRRRKADGTLEEFLSTQKM